MLLIPKLLPKRLDGTGPKAIFFKSCKSIISNRDIRPVSIATGLFLLEQRKPRYFLAVYAIDYGFVENLKPSLLPGYLLVLLSNSLSINTVNSRAKLTQPQK